MAAQYAGITLLTGIAIIVVNFGAVERNTAGLADAVIGVALITVVAVAAGWGIAHVALRPLREVTAVTKQISASNLHQRIGLEGPNDELHQLASTIDDLLTRLEAGFDRERRFVANASHEIRTPLAVTRAALELGLNSANPTVTDLQAVIAQALDATGRSETLAADLLLLAQSESVAVERGEWFDLGQLAADVVNDVASGPGRADIIVTLDLEPALMWGNPGLIDRLVANLVDNAVRYTGPSGWITVSTKADDEGAHLVVRNHTAGPGGEPVEELFEPFRRGAPTGGERSASGAGHGLGLSIVRAIARSHGAEPIARRSPAGDTFEVELHFANDGGDDHSSRPLAATGLR
jgi:signal transduction histidine kinase